jgi:histidinol-phosphate/aromatic aminotransferase/cobyric acid decarboxylase-like protein
MHIDGGDRVAALLARRRAMEIERGDGDSGYFLFGWQCENPYAEPLLKCTEERAKSLDRVKYSYLEDNKSLAQAISDMHEAFGEQRPSSVFSGAGAISVIFAFAAFVKNRGIEEIYYVPPLYFSFHAALRLLGLRARPISSHHAFEAEFKMNLPNKQTVLIVTDPIWYAGQPVPSSVVPEIIAWQRRTESVVFVDGSFQYMRWDKTVTELSASFDPRWTMRLVSPTKSLAVSGYRFAYCHMPAEWWDDFAHVYTNIYGSANTDSIAFGLEAISAMKFRNITNRLVELISCRHRDLRRRRAIESSIGPISGFFAFEKILARLPDGYLIMGGEYFDQPRFPGYARLNLLSPSLGLLAQ